MNEIAEKEYDPDQTRTVPVVSHGMAMRQFLNQIHGPDQVPSNCEIAHVLFDNDGFHFVKIIDPLHAESSEKEKKDA